ncbi:hypothetical protein, partial [Citrobacter youngae]|uniref:hypothetical protein n=1 Tax=Citrobacter youngae TaxID=133448 RepID=UPI0013D300A9
VRQLPSHLLELALEEGNFLVGVGERHEAAEHGHGFAPGGGENAGAEHPGGGGNEVAHSHGSG